MPSAIPFLCLLWDIPFVYLFVQVCNTIFDTEDVHQFGTEGTCDCAIASRLLARLDMSCAIVCLAIAKYGPREAIASTSASYRLTIAAVGHWAPSHDRVLRRSGPFC